jgi:hypothetical protein
MSHDRGPPPPGRPVTSDCRRLPPGSMSPVTSKRDEERSQPIKRAHPSPTQQSAAQGSATPTRNTARRQRQTRNRRTSSPALGALSRRYCHVMNTWAAAGWGLAGGLCVEALALYSLIHKTRRWTWRKPIPQGLAAYLISVTLRAGAGAGLAAAAAGSGQVSGPLAAFGLGVAAPLVVEKLSRAISLTGTLIVTDPPPETEDTHPAPAAHPQMETANPGGSDTGGAGDAR